MPIASLDQIAAAALSSRETIQTTYDLARLAIERGVPGDFVECGVFGGAQCAAMAKAIEDAAAYRDHPQAKRNWAGARRVHLFDSFEGIPAPGPHDEGWAHPIGTSACSLEDVKSNMRQWGVPDELLVWHPGMFESTLGGEIDQLGCVSWPAERLNRVKQIALLRLDGDLYESTKVCIEHLYPLVSTGGWIIVDDYALPGCRKAVDDFMKGYPPIYFQKHV